MECGTLQQLVVQFTLYYLSSGSVKTKENFNLLALKEVAVAYKGGRLLEVPNIFDWKSFGVLENWPRSMTRCSRNRRFDCIALIYSKILLGPVYKEVG